MSAKFYIEIENTVVISRKWQRDGREGMTHKQEAVLHGKRFPAEMTVNLPAERDGQPYAPGKYWIDFEKGVDIDQYGGLKVDSRFLVPLDETRPLAKSA